MIDMMGNSNFQNKSLGEMSQGKIKTPMPEKAFNLWPLKPAMATLHISSNSFDHRNLKEPVF